MDLLLTASQTTVNHRIVGLAALQYPKAGSDHLAGYLDGGLLKGSGVFEHYLLNPGRAG